MVNAASRFFGQKHRGMGCLYRQSEGDRKWFKA